MEPLNVDLMPAEVSSTNMDMATLWNAQANSMIDEINRAISQIPEVAQGQVKVGIQCGVVVVPIVQAVIEIPE